MGRALDVVIAIARKVQALGGAEMTGRMPVGVLLLFVAGFTTLVLLRSRLRIAGLRRDCRRSRAGHVASSRRAARTFSFPKTACSSACRWKRGIATNRRRPPSFVFDQWLAALAQTRADRAGGTCRARGRSAGEGPARRGRTRRRPIRRAVAAMRGALDRHAAGFLCYGRKWCAADVAGGLPVVTVSDPAFVGPACDLARIVVVARPLRMTDCRSGVLLITGRTLRRSGSIEIAVDRMDNSRDAIRSARRKHRARRLRPAPAGPAAAYRLTIRSALGGVVRPWTVQRYYDWRSRSFDLDAAGSEVRTLVITAD